MPNVNQTNILTLFRKVVLKHPDNIAVVEEGDSITYSDLDCKSNAIANAIGDKCDLERSNMGEQIIAIHMDKSRNYICSMLAILKLGYAFLPIDKELPSARKKYLLKNSNAKLILLDEALDFHVDQEMLKYENLDNKNIQGLDQKHISENQLAYVIYTSGTTGNPKGVMIEHKGIVNINRTWSEDFGIGSSDATVLFASVSFDASLWEIFMMLLNGGTIHILADESLKNVRLLEAYLKANGISVITLPPAYLTHAEPESLKPLKYVFSAGASISAKLYNTLIQKGVRLVNAYGPTETTICATVWLNTEQLSVLDNVPIGYPIKGFDVHIIKEDGSLANENELGELCISGCGLSRGYLYQTELTNEKFVFLDETGTYIYKTGDLGFMDTYGMIYFKGRTDRQVKVRGYRVELSEVESKLAGIENVMDAAVVFVDEKLHAFVKLRTGKEDKNVMGHLKLNLPKYMIPNSWHFLDEIPITINGKHDWDKLKEMIRSSSSELINIKQYVKNDMSLGKNVKAIVIGIYEKVLDIKGIDDAIDFYGLGGDSIHAIQIVAKLYDKGYSLKVHDVLSSLNMDELVNKIEKIEVKRDEESLLGYFPLLPIQKWFIEEQFKNRNQWNQAISFEVSHKVPLAVIEESCEAIVMHHDSLRIRLSEFDDVTYLKYGTEVSNGYSVKTYEVEDLKTLDHIILEAQSKLDLIHGPLMHVAVVYVQEKTIIFIVIHHFVMDGISLRIFSEDFAYALKCRFKDKEIEFPNKTSSYKDWSVFINDSLLKGRFRDDEIYWIKQISSANNINRSIRKRMIGNGNRKGHDIKKTIISREKTHQMLVALPRHFNCSVNDILIGIINEIYKKLWDIDGILANFETHGRILNGYEGENSRTAGWYTAQYPICIPRCINTNYGEKFAYIKNLLDSIPNNGISFEAIKYRCKDHPLNTYPIPVINFNYLGEIKGGNLNESISIMETFAENMGASGLGNISDEDVNYFPINMSAFTYKEQFHLHVGYDISMVSIEHMSEAVDRFTYELDNAIRDMDAGITRARSKYEFSHDTLKDYELTNIYNFLKNKF